MPRATTGLRTATRDSPCSHCGQVTPRLRKCRACGSVAYCSTECQTAAWKQHSPICRTLSASSDAETSDGHTALLFDRALGGFFSVAQRRIFLSRGPGVVVAALSAPPAAFRESVSADASHPRSVAFRYVPEAAVPSLDAVLALAAGVENCRLVEHAHKGLQRLLPDVPGRYDGQMYVLVTRTSNAAHDRYAPKVTLMMNWLAEDHGAHAAFRDELGISDADLIGSTFDWDSKEIVLPPGNRVARIPSSIDIIGKDFYDECMQKHRRRKASKTGPGPLPGYPPLAQTISICRVPEE